MENASKALIMAGSILIALIILGSLLLMFNSLSNYQDANIQNEREAQVLAFNNQFETYNRDKVRGSDMISLMNRIIDYNTRKTTETSDEKYQKMEITINISNQDLKKLVYDSEFVKNSNSKLLFIRTKYTQDNINDVLKEIKNIENKYQQKYIVELVNNISRIIGVDNESAKECMQEIIPSGNIYHNVNTWRYNIQVDVSKYYEYSQFKKLYFNCTNIEYNQNTGRIIKMEFESTGKFE